MTDTPMPERQAHAIEHQRQIAALPLGAAFHQSFRPHTHAVDLLAMTAASDSRFSADARTVLDEWRNCLATQEQMRRVAASGELEVGGGAVMSQADGGYWISTWTWAEDEG